MAFWAQPCSLDYCKGGNAFGAQAWTAIYEGLLSFDYKPKVDFHREMEAVPYLAERWEQSDDTAYIFHLRKGVKWHDGKSLTADAVVLSLNYIRDKKNACTKRSKLAGVKSVELVMPFVICGIPGCTRAVGEGRDYWWKTLRTCAMRLST